MNLLYPEEDLTRRLERAGDLGQRLLERAAAEGGPMFLGKPERWFADPRWRCPNDHVSVSYLKSESRGGPLCLECEEPVFLTFPEDADGPLSEKV